MGSEYRVQVGGTADRQTDRQEWHRVQNNKGLLNHIGYMFRPVNRLSSSGLKSKQISGAVLDTGITNIYICGCT